METEGSLAPATPAEAREEYAALVPAAKVTVREAARAMEFDREEYRERVTGDVVATVRDALFASLLRVHVGTREEYEAWLDDHPGYEPDPAGSENVDNVVWHPVPFGADRAGDGTAAPTADDSAGDRDGDDGGRGDDSGVVVAATWHEEREAALGTLRRRAFGRVYRPHLDTNDADAESAVEAGDGRTDADDGRTDGSDEPADGPTDATDGEAVDVNGEEPASGPDGPVDES